MKRILALLALFLLLLPVAAQAQRADQPEDDGGFHERIAAVVNDNVISTSDLTARINMAFLSSGLPDTPEVRQRLLLQVLHGMVDEQLELQEAKKLGITITQDEIDQALAHIQHDNNIPVDMRTYLESHGIAPDALADQIRAGLAWARVVQRELRPLVEVGDDEIDAAIERQRANAGKQEYQVLEIFLAVDSPKDEDRIRQLADSLAQKLHEGGNFGAIAHQFSQSSSAAAGGDIGWVQQGQLPPELDRALGGMHTGEISNPIRSASGYHIVALREKRTIAFDGVAEPTAEMQQLFRPFGADRHAVLEEAAQIQSSVSGCADLPGKVAAQFPGWRWQDLGEIRLSSSPAWLAAKAKELPIGKPSEALQAGKGAMILIVCDRKTPDKNGLSRDTIAAQIGTEKLELQARRLLRDLRREAYLDIRLALPRQ